MSVPGTNRNLDMLHVDLYSAFVKMRLVMEVLGHPIFLVEGFRTKERQEHLFNAGITRVIQSKHLKGRAIDVAFKKGDPYGWEHPWELLGAIGNALGLRWGGEWKSKDSTHFELPGGE
jgi:hypothetical protein